MYHGIIQVGNFAGPGTYLRARIQQYDLDKVIHKGRIWRLVYDGVKPDRSDALRRDRIVPRMNDETPAQLVSASQPSERLVARHGAAAARPQAGQVRRARRCSAMARNVDEPARAVPRDVDARRARRAQAGAGAPADGGPGAADAHPGDSRERDALQGRRSIVRRRLHALTKDSERRRRDPGDADDESLEGRRTRRRPPRRRWRATRRAASSSSATTMLNPPASARRAAAAAAALTPEQQGPARSRRADLQRAVLRLPRPRTALGTPKPELATTMAPPLAGSPRVNGHRDYIIKAVLHGLDRPGRRQDLHGHDDPDGQQRRRVDCRRGARTSATASATPAASSRRRTSRACAPRPPAATTLWTLPELTASLPAPLFTDGWKLTASHNADAAIGALTLTTWNAGGRNRRACGSRSSCRRPETVTEIQFQSPAPGGRGGPGDWRRRRPGGAPVAGPPGFPRGIQSGSLARTARRGRAVAEGTGTGPARSSRSRRSRRSSCA